MPSNFPPISNPFAFARNGGRVAIAMGLFGVAAIGPLAMAQSGSLQSITEREIQRRNNLVSTAEAQLSEGQLLLEKDKAEEASKAFMTAYSSLPEVAATESVRARLRAAYASAACIWAKNLLNEGHYADASKVIDSVLDEDVDPHNKEALRLRKQAADPDRYPPALTAKHVADTKEAARLLVLAASYMDLGSPDKALSTYRDVLRIDPYNTAARRGMEKVEQFKSRYQHSARDHTRSSMISAVDAQWEDAIPPSDKLAETLASSGGGGSITTTGRDVIEQKLRTLKIPHVEFNNATLDEVIEYLRVTSRNLDQDGRGVDFIVSLEPEARNHQLSLNLSNVPLEELLRYVTQIAGAAYRVENNAVVIGSLTERSTTLITKSYKVPPDFIQTAAVDTAATGPAAADPFAKQGAPTGIANGLQVRRMGAREFLEGRGVTFPDGASASFSGGSSTLIVRNTVDNLNMVDMLVETALASGSKQAVITVKMIDVSQTRLNELGFDWESGSFNVPGSNKVFASGGGINGASAQAFNDAMPAGGNAAATLITGGLRSSGEILGKPTIGGLIAGSAGTGGTISPDSRSPAQFALVGVFTDPSFQMAIRSLSQSKGVDLVAAPTITTKSGQKSSVRVVREFPYPTEFDPPQIPQSVNSNTNGNGGGGGTTLTLISATGLVTSNAGLTGPVPITPTTPTAFTTKELGIILEVEPVISGDGRTVELSLTPSDVEFEGFIDYGSPITTVDQHAAIDLNLFAFVSTGSTQTVHENHIYQPVFRNTHTTTSVNVYDGATVVIGGLVSEKRTDINDKVPVIGDLPLVGRFWQSKVTQSEKRCVLFFVNVKVIDPSGQQVNRTTVSAQ